MHRIGFGGGCHWCTEAVFAQLVGVTRVEQGWIAAGNENKNENENENGNDDGFSEAVIVHYDVEQISLEALVKIHLHTHSCTSNHALRKKYRSAVYFFEAKDIPAIEKAIDANRDSFAEAIITQVLPFVSFKENKEQYQNYYQKNPEGQFCQTYIVPKIELLKTEFSEFLS